MLPISSNWQDITSIPQSYFDDETEILVAGGTYASDDVSCEIISAPNDRVRLVRYEEMYETFVAVENSSIRVYPTNWQEVPEFNL
jgi:hypothetical protein